MNEQRHKGLSFAAYIILCALATQALLGGCKTVTEAVTTVVHDTTYVARHDTVQVIVHKHDSVVDVQTLILRDTVINEKERVVVLNQAGDTVKDWMWNTTTHHTHESDESKHVENHDDSTRLLMSRIDSLLKSMDSRQAKKTVVQPSIPAWQYCLVIGVLMAILVWVFKSKIL